MKLLKFFTCFVLVASMLATAIVPVSAARATYYLSDLKLAEADSAEAAKTLLTEKGYTVLDKNLNPGGGKAVYLGYKRSTNVEDAITDVRVMNMNGGFNITDYEAIKQDAIQEYKKTVDNFRIAAKEFAENYLIGKKEALLAYRQLNYYYVEKDGVKTNMGDYMLNFPEKNDSFSDILFKGNPNILNNIRILLAMGVSDGGALIDRIKAAVENEAVYGKTQYFEDAKELALKTQQLKQLLDETKAEIEEIKAAPDMTDEEKETALIMPRYTITLLAAFDVILKDIPMGEDSNYSKYFDQKSITDYSVLYPFVDAMTPGQRAMAVSGQLHSVLVYNCVEMSDEELENELNKLEESYEPMSVYLGTDMDLLEGAVGVTSDALREQAATGNQWFACFTGNMALDITISALFGAGGATLVGVSYHYLNRLLDAGSDVVDGGAFGDMSFVSEVDEAIIFDVDDMAESSDMLIGSANDSVSSDISVTLDKVSATNNTASSSGSVAGSFFVSFGMVVGVIMIILSITSIVRIINKYNTEYTAIPSNMVDTVETVNGKRYVNYKVVNSLYKDGSKTVEKPGDTNGYNGEQWNAIYYTKSYEAGKCMTANGYVLDSASDFGKYTPVAKFGSKTCYDLNAYNGQKSKDTIYIAFGNSNNKKAAETAVPTVIGSMISYGSIALSGAAGLLLGMGAMTLIKRKKKTT